MRLATSAGSRTGVDATTVWEQQKQSSPVLSAGGGVRSARFVSCADPVAPSVTRSTEHSCVSARSTPVHTKRQNTTVRTKRARFKRTTDRQYNVVRSVRLNWARAHPLTSGARAYRAFSPGRHTLVWRCAWADAFEWSMIHFCSVDSLRLQEQRQHDQCSRPGIHRHAVSMRRRCRKR